MFHRLCNVASAVVPESSGNINYPIILLIAITLMSVKIIIFFVYLYFDFFCSSIGIIILGFLFEFSWILRSLDLYFSHSLLNYLDGICLKILIIFVYHKFLLTQMIKMLFFFIFTEYLKFREILLFFVNLNTQYYLLL